MVKYQRNGWWRLDDNTYEYLAENPTDLMQSRRKPKAIVHANMQYKWVADATQWEGNSCMRFQKLGIFKENHLEKAMLLVELHFQQLSFFV